MHRTPVRFKDIAVGEFFYMDFGGTFTMAEKIAENEIKLKKLNNPGFMTVKLHPELNQDDCFRAK